MYKCKYFKISELVAPAVAKVVPENTLWAMFDDRLLRCADLIREKYGPCTVNGGGLTDCGLRDWTSKTGAKYSAHKFARALDIHILAIERTCAGNKTAKAAEYDRVRRELMADMRFNALNFEKTVSGAPCTWLHCDTYNRANRLFAA